MQGLCTASVDRARHHIFTPRWGINRCVINKGSEVAAHYEGTEPCQAPFFARHPAARTTHSVSIYEVNGRFSLPPPPGTSVDPEEDDWVLVSYRRSAVRCAKAPLLTRIAQPTGDR